MTDYCIPILPPEPAIHCACCNQKSPMEMQPLFMQHGRCLKPQPAGWCRIFFPWPERIEGAREPESSWLCPKCGLEVAKMVAHLKHPGLTEYEIL